MPGLNLNSIHEFLPVVQAPPGGLDEHRGGKAEADQLHGSPRHQDSGLLHGRSRYSGNTYVLPEIKVF